MPVNAARSFSPVADNPRQALPHCYSKAPFFLWGPQRPQTEGHGQQGAPTAPSRALRDCPKRCELTGVSGSATSHVHMAMP